MTQKIIVTLLMVWALLLGVCCGLLAGKSLKGDKNQNHNTQAQCEYVHETKCINAWIKESMQNPKSKRVNK